MTPRARDRLNRIASRHGVTWQQICSPSRKAPVVAARNEFWRWLRGEGYSLPEIGRHTGHHHTTVLHGIRTTPVQPRPKPPEPQPPSEGSLIVSRIIAAMKAKHQRELAQRY